jgi:hypothetical protein
MWLRVFAATDDVPDLAALADGLAEVLSFAADETGWYAAEVVPGDGPPIALERFTADEDSFRAELNAWAAYLETLGDGEAHVALMERVIQSRQLITVQTPAGEDGAARLGAALARRAAHMTGGFYQIDGEGFFDAEGELLVAEER